jgi:hypothetical protein
MAAAPAALLVLLAAILLAGCGGSGSSSAVTNTVVVKTAGAQGASSTAQSTSASTPGGVQSGGSASTSTSSGSSTSGTGHTAALPVSGHLLRRYSGTGNTRLGTIVVHSSSVLVWSAQHAPIQVFTSTGFILLNSSSLTGSTKLSGGTYRGVRVASHAGWSLQLRTPAP